MTMEVITQRSLTIAQEFEYSIPQSGDKGDALYVAHQILDASYHHCSKNSAVIPQSIRLIVMKARDYVGRQYAEYLRGGE